MLSWLEDFRFLIHDRGSNFTASFDAVFQAAGTTILRTAVQAPRMNATCERLVGTLRRELLDRVLILGAAHLLAVLAEYQEHYNTARRTRESVSASPTLNTSLPASRQGTSTLARSAETCPERPDQRVLPSRMNSKKTRLTTQNPTFERHAADSRRPRPGAGPQDAQTTRSAPPTPAGREVQLPDASPTTTAPCEAR